MKYQLIILVIAILTTTAGAAQHNRPSPSMQYEEFLAADTSISGSPDSHEYLVCCIDSVDVIQFRKNRLINMLRQLNDSVFIISFNKKASAADVNFRLRWVKRANANWKMSPTLLLQDHGRRLIFPNSFLISVHDGGGFAETIKRNKTRLTSTPSACTFIVLLNNRGDFEELLNDRDVFFISLYNTRPKEELQINDLDLSVNKINVLHSRLPVLNGDGITISIKENAPDTSDMDYAARYLSNPLEAATSTSHASIMATMAAGAGNSWYLGRGVAQGAAITSSNFSNLLPDPDTNYQRFHISVQNHSYGVGIENFYGADAAAYDEAALRNDSLLFVFSAGNSGNLTPSTGNYSGLKGYANLTGSFKMAKNIITVGAVDSFTIVANASSRGPAFDGRVKPELVAYGEDGSSGAAALVSGTAAVLQQAYKNAGTGKLPPTALVKAILINSADDVGPVGIDYTSGYGNLDAFKASENILAKRYYGGSVLNNDSTEFSIAIPANILQAKFTLVWQDAAAAPNAYKALVNDLDMELQMPSSGEVWKPWVLSSVANSDSLSSRPTRKRDSLNNVEQITIDNPVGGVYKIEVKGFRVSGPAQSFYVAWQLDTLNEFSWDFPVSADNIFPGEPNIIRYQTTLRSGAAHLLYSIDKGNNWQLADSLVDITKGYLYWDAPDTTVLAMLKMEIARREFTSDTFTISKKLDFRVGFNCPDSVLWYWNRSAGINNYRIFGLPGAYLQPVASITDTSYKFKKTNVNYQEFAVAPVIDGRVGVKSYTTNYTAQGIACYVNNFLGDLVNNKTTIQLELGTTYLIKRIVFEKLLANSIIPLLVINNINGLNYSTSDSDLQKGINTYRARIDLSDGRIIYSASTGIFYLGNTDVIIFPNPVIQNSNLTVQFKNLQNQQIKIADVSGRIIINRKTNTTTVNFPFVFAKGLYFLSVINPETNTTSSYKLICY